MHRVQRVPVTEKEGRIHTSTASVVVMPEADEVSGSCCQERDPVCHVADRQEDGIDCKIIITSPGIVHPLSLDLWIII